MTNIDTFIFDLGGVINDHDNDMLIARLLSKCDGRATDEALIKAFCQDIYSTGENSIVEFFTMLRRDFGYKDNWQTFTNDWCCHLSMRPGMLEFLREFRKSFRILFLSNTNLLHWNRLLELSNFELASYEAFLSFDMGLSKPSKAVFEKLLLSADVSPQRAIFIDDRQENIDQAISCGLGAFLYQGQGEFEDFLETSPLILYNS